MLGSLYPGYKHILSHIFTTQLINLSQNGDLNTLHTKN